STGFEWAVARGRAIQHRSLQLPMGPARCWAGGHSTMISPPSSLMLSPGSRNCEGMYSTPHDENFKPSTDAIRDERNSRFPIFYCIGQLNPPPYSIIYGQILYF